MFWTTFPSRYWYLRKNIESSWRYDIFPKDTCLYFWNSIVRYFGNENESKHNLYLGFLMVLRSYFIPLSSPKKSKNWIISKLKKSKTPRLFQYFNFQPKISIYIMWEMRNRDWTSVQWILCQSPNKAITFERKYIENKLSCHTSRTQNTEYRTQNTKPRTQNTDIEPFFLDIFKNSLFLFVQESSEKTKNWRELVRLRRIKWCFWIFSMDFLY